MLIEGQPDMEVAGQASNGVEAVALAKHILPDVALLDVAMPELGGVAACEQIVASCPGVRVIALARHADPGYVRRLLQAGARGYVLMKSAGDALINAIRTVAQGGTYVEPSLAGAMLQRTYSPPKAATKSAAAELSLREEEVMRAIAWGRSNKEIAAELGLSIKTVESYKAAALDKLELRNRADIVRYALGRGWFTEDSAPE